MPLYFPRTAVNQELTLAGPPSLLTRLTFSVMGWFRTPSAAAYRHIYAEDAAFNIQVYIRIGNDSKFDVWFRTPTGIAQITATVNYDDDVWHWFLFVRRATNDFQVWVDGTSIGTSAVTVGTDATATPKAIGNWSATGSGPSDLPWLGHLMRLIALADAVTTEEARKILRDGITGRAKLWHFELDGRVPEITVGGTGAVGQAYVAASTVAPGASQVGLPPGVVPLPDRAPPGMLDWLITDTPADPGPSVDQQRIARSIYVPRR